MIKQIIDVTSNNWMVEFRSSTNPNQVVSPGEGQVNQTFQPFSSRRRPFSQGTINFDILERYYRPAQEAE